MTPLSCSANQTLVGFPGRVGWPAAPGHGLRVRF